MNSEQNLASNKYISGLESRAQEETQSKQSARQISDSDPFRISSVGGRGFMILFYAGLVAGILCAGLGVILSVTPGSAPEDVIKQNLMNSSSKWIYDNKQSLLKNFNVQLDLLSLDDMMTFSQIENTSTNSKNKNAMKKKQQNAVVDRSTMELKDSLSISQQRSQSSNNAYKFGENSYSTPFVSLENAHFESKINFNAEPVIPEGNHCLQVKINDSEMKELTVEGLPQCGTFANSLPINLVQNKVLKFSEMIKMKMCSDNLSCEQICDSNNGISHAIQNKKGKNSHSLDKSYEIQSQTCTAAFAVKEICLVFSVDNKKSTISKFEGGCYDGNYLIYDFESKISETSVVLREKEDPVLASIYYSNDYSPYVVEQTQKEKTALILYYTGAGIFALLILSLIVIRIKEERNADNFTKVSRVTELSSVQTTLQN